MSKDNGREIAKSFISRIRRLFSRLGIKSIGSFRYFPVYIKAICKEWQAILWGETVVGAVITIAACWLGTMPLSVIFCAGVVVAGFFAWYAEYPKHPDLTESDILELMQQVPDLKADDIKSEMAKLISHLARNRITTRKQLSDLVNATDCLDVIRNLYHKCLKRPPGNNLDPLAVADYVAKLYSHGRDYDVKLRLEREIADSYSNGAR